MISIAFLCACVYQVCYILDNFTSTQAFTRPIFIGTLVGAVTGDLKTGIIMGAELEAINMGVSHVGGVAPTDIRVSTILAIALVNTQGIPQEVGLSLAVTVGALINATKPISKAIRAFYHPIFTKLHEAGNYKGFTALYLLDGLLTKNLFEALIVFFSLALGTEILTNAINVIPPFVLNGLNAASGMLVAVGVCLVSMSIWGKYTPVYIMIGFVLSKFVGLEIVVITIIGVVIALLEFKQNMKIADAKSSSAVTSNSIEGDDFYA